MKAALDGGYLNATDLTVTGQGRSPKLAKVKFPRDKE